MKLLGKIKNQRRSYYVKDIEDLKMRLERRSSDAKYNYIGSGCFSVAYGIRGTNLVWKIHHDYIAAKKDGYSRFAKPVLNRKIVGSWVPRIFLCLKDKKTGVCAYLMERFEETYKTRFDKVFDFKRCSTWRSICPVAEKIIDDLKNETILVYEEQRKSSNTVANALAGIAYSDVHIDIHANNVMFRKNGDFVMIDPFI